MEDLDALLADLEVSLPTYPFPPVSALEKIGSVKQQVIGQEFISQSSSAASQPSSSSFATCVPDGSQVVKKSHLVSLSNNLSELDNLLSELDAVQLCTQNGDMAVGDYDLLEEEENNNGQTAVVTVNRIPLKPETGPVVGSATKASQELDALMGSLSDMALKQEMMSGGFSPEVWERHQRLVGSSAGVQSKLVNGSSAVKVTSAKTAELSGVVASSTLPCSDLNDLLVALDKNLAAQGIVVESKGCCAACSKPIVGAVIAAVGQLWHPEHFSCYHCNEALAGRNYFERDLQAYCERDYHLLFSPKCEVCAGPILHKCVTAFEKTWHPEHFACADCQRSLVDARNFHLENGKIYCHEDYVKNVVPKCDGCSKSIVGSHTSALNREWHPECFVCSDCRVPFGSSRYFEGVDGKPYCEVHIAVKGRAPQCAGCDGLIVGRCMTALGRRYHPEHFLCTFCRSALTRGVFKELDGRAYCNACFRRLSGH